MDEKLRKAIERLERACISGMDDEFKDDVETVLAVFRWRLPCPVRVPPGTTIGAGCMLSTVLTALKVREENPEWFGDMAVAKFGGEA